MARGSFNFRELKEFANHLQNVVDTNVIDDFMRECIMDIAKKMLRKVKNRTPFNTGQLKTGWTIGAITKTGDVYEIEVFNNVEHAPFIENGFRAHWVPGYWSSNQFVYDPTASTGMQVGKPGGWVAGKFMMKISEKEIDREMPKFMKRKQMELTKKIMKGR